MRARTPARILASTVARRSAAQSARYASTSTSSPSSSSSSTSTSWQPALPRGSSAVYDEALDYLSAHRDRCVAEYEKLRSISNPTDEQIAEAEGWEVDAYVNDPAVRALFRATKGQGHMERPVMRHLAERRWKKQGGLDLIMGRIYQNKVVPDVLPDLAPSNPLTLSVPAGIVEPGLTIDVKSLESPPVLHYQPFQHPAYPTPSDPHPSALYTLVALDPDTPNTTRHGYTQRLHYLKTNIPLSVVSGQTALIQEAGGNEIVGWEPHAPAPKTQKHRLIFVLLRQTNDSRVSGDTARISELTEAIPRENFNLRSLMATFGFQLDSVVGVNLVRSEWTEENKEYVDKIWRDFRGIPEAPAFKEVSREVLYGRPPSSIQRRATELREKAWQRSLEEYERTREDAEAEFLEAAELELQEKEEADVLDNEAVAAFEASRKVKALELEAAEEEAQAPLVELVEEEEVRTK